VLVPVVDAALRALRADETDAAVPPLVDDARDVAVSRLFASDATDDPPSWWSLSFLSSIVVAT